MCGGVFVEVGVLVATQEASAPEGFIAEFTAVARKGGGWKLQHDEAKWMMRGWGNGDRMESNIGAVPLSP